MFNKADGAIKNIALCGRLIVTMNRTNTTNYQARVGGFCAEADDLNIESVANNVNLSVTNNCGDKAYAGGLVGYGETVTITDSYNTGDVSASTTGDSSASAGGLVGYGYFAGTVTITDCYYTLPENSHNNYGEKKSSVAEIVAIMENLWDSSVWDFDNLDENGNPTLRY